MLFVMNQSMSQNYSVIYIFKFMQYSTKPIWTSASGLDLGSVSFRCLWILTVDRLDSVGSLIDMHAKYSCDDSKNLFWVYREFVSLYCPLMVHSPWLYNGSQSRHQFFQAIEGGACDWLSAVRITTSIRFNITRVFWSSLWGLPFFQAYFLSDDSKPNSLKGIMYAFFKKWCPLNSEVQWRHFDLDFLTADTFRIILKPTDHVCITVGKKPRPDKVPSEKSVLGKSFGLKHVARKVGLGFGIICCSAGSLPFHKR